MGYSEVFLSPVDWISVKKNLNEALAKVSAKVKAYHPVKLIDIKPGTILDFDTFVYLPMNDRYVHYSRKGEPINEARAKQLADHKVTTLFVESNSLQSFYRDVSQRLKSQPGNLEILGTTQKTEKMRAAVREFFSKFFNSSIVASEKTGLALTEELKKIVSEYILQPEQGDWFLPFLFWAGEPYEAYTHAANVALYSSIFSARLGIGKPEDLAIAGLLHDCGMANVPSDTLNKAKAEWTPQDLKNYQRHPEFSCVFIKNRKLVLAPRVLEVILQHHESPNGSGHPKGLTEVNMNIEAQLISLADRIDYLISIEPGKARISPVQALKVIYGEISMGPKSEFLSPEIVRRVLEMLPAEVE